MSRYQVGTDVIGAVFVRVKDPAGIARAKGGRLGGLAAGLIPETLAIKIDDEIRSKMLSKFQDEGVSDYIETSIVKDSPGDRKSNFWSGLLIGAGAAGAGYFLVKLVRGMLR